MENQYHQLSHHQTLSASEAGHRVQDGLGGSTKVFNITRPMLFFRVRKSLKTNHWQKPHSRMLVDMGGWKRRQPLPVAPRTGAPPQLRQRQTGGRDRRLVQLVQLATARRRACCCPVDPLEQAAPRIILETSCARGCVVL